MRYRTSHQAGRSATHARTSHCCRWGMRVRFDHETNGLYNIADEAEPLLTNFLQPTRTKPLRMPRRC